MRVLRGTDTRTSSGKVLFSPLWHRADGQRCLLQLKPDPLNGGGARENTLSTFEYMSVMHSIVLALGIARVLGGFADVARDWRVIEAKWRFLGWLLLLLVLQLGWWFGLWARFSTVPVRADRSTMRVLRGTDTRTSSGNGAYHSYSRSTSLRTSRNTNRCSRHNAAPTTRQRGQQPRSRQQPERRCRLRNHAYIRLVRLT
jgi:hypothetical protein